MIAAVLSYRHHKAAFCNSWELGAAGILFLEALLRKKNATVGPHAAAEFDGNFYCTNTMIA